jgi:hypothetical protein
VLSIKSPDDGSGGPARRFDLLDDGPGGQLGYRRITPASDRRGSPSRDRDRQTRARSGPRPVSRNLCAQTDQDCCPVPSGVRRGAPSGCPVPEPAAGRGATP